VSFIVFLRQLWIRVELESVFLCNLSLWMGYCMSKVEGCLGYWCLVSSGAGGDRIRLYSEQDYKLTD